MLGHHKDTTMPTPHEALPGRQTKMPVPARHYVLDTPLVAPFPAGCEVAYLGLGCFWGAEKCFWKMPGVYTSAVGYAGGLTPNPTYQEVCSGLTGHNEVVMVVFDTAKIDYGQVLKMFWESHNPTQGMRQGNDVGTQYRSAVFWHTPEQRAEAEALIAELTAAKQFDAPIVTEVTEVVTIYPAENYHQGYFDQNPNQPYCQFVVAPKVVKARTKYASRLKD